MATRRDAAEHRWRLRAARRPAIVSPDPEPGWLDGPIGALRAAAILIGAALLGLAIGAIDSALRQPGTHGEAPR
ncbi:MAG TPA: hypothetical protein PKD99_02465 [Sphingopyxis sp.]|nr:hypothetical protein [Sphingopyxis sp.]HMP43941.1 hypothetical protein [Sphingopyxis sp.]HMQ20022.1 hypothetical protein [Sphingopyxis sp.]